MGYTAPYGRVLIRTTVFEKEQAALVKKGLEESGIIYTEEGGEVCFSVAPKQRGEDFYSTKERLLSAPR